MATLWFLIVLLMVAAYVVLDGFDLGAGVIYRGAAKTPDERRNIMRASGPVSIAWPFQRGDFSQEYFESVSSTR